MFSTPGCLLRLILLVDRAGGVAVAVVANVRGHTTENGRNAKERD
jgi:hypothetical protein